MKDLRLQDFIEKLVAYGVVYGFIFLSGGTLAWLVPEPWPNRDTVIGALILGSVVIAIIATFVVHYIILWVKSGRVGVQRIYTSYEHAIADILVSMDKSVSIRILTQLGRNEFLGDEFANVFKKLLQVRGKNIKIAFAANDSALFSKERLEALGRNFEDLQSLLDSVAARVGRLKTECLKNNNRFEVIRHGEPFLFKLFLFDHEAYMMFYTYPSEADFKASVFRIREREGSLYKVVKEYYDHLENKYRGNQQAGG